MRQHNIIGMTFCSGIGAPEVAAPWVDWRLASEIEPFPRAVLQERFGYRLPEDHNQGDPLLWGDMTEVTPDLLRSRGIPLPDLIVAGTPCQAFSVAGARKGLEDPRGNLTLAFVEICHAIVDARPDGKLAVLWENVPGVLSDRGNAFGCFLGGLVGALDALPPPGDGSWPGEGMVQGPRARAAWAVLDAQWFGVAQRRRRVFVVVDFGNCVDPAAVLLEPDRLRGDTPPRRETGQGAAADAAQGIGIGGDEIAFDTYNQDCGPVTHTLRAQSAMGDAIPAIIASTGNVPHCLNAGGLIAAEVAPTLNAHFGDKMGLENQHINGGCGLFVSHTLKGEGFDASEDGTGRGTPIVPVARAFDWQTGGDMRGVELRETAQLQRCQTPAVAFDTRGRDGGAMPERPHDTANIRAASGGSSRSYIADPWAVRRLMPVECARLQGFPDHHTAITYRGKPAADGPQYKAYGNSMAVPVVRWIMERMRISMEDNA